MAAMQSVQDDTHPPEGRKEGRNSEHPTDSTHCSPASRRVAESKNQGSGQADYDAEDS